MSFNLPFGVRVAGNQPVDADRYIATTITQRNSLVTNGRAYDGLQVYVEADKTLYILKGTTNSDWNILGTGGGGGGIYVAGDNISISGTNVISTTYQVGTLNILNTGTDTALSVYSPLILNQWIASKNFLTSVPAQSWTSITGKPTTIGGYGITDFNSLGDARWSLTSHNHTGVYEPVFSKNSGFNRNFGTVANTVAEGNDSRILSGATAFSWGNHANAGYSTQTLAAGAGIQIVNNVISATGGGGGGGGDWGTIGGTLSNQIDLTNALNNKADLVHTHTFASLTLKPTTIAGYGITDFDTLGDGRWAALNHNHSGVYEPSFNKNTAFNKNYGTSAGTVAQGNDSRILNGNTAFTWGNHNSMGYSTQTLTAGANITISGSNEISAINTDTTYSVFTTGVDGLVPGRVGSTTNRYLNEQGIWSVPPNTTYAASTLTTLNTGTDTTANTHSPLVLNQWLNAKNFSTQTLVAGTNISIVGNVISATNSTVVWGGISGTISDQTDLNSVLLGKENTFSKNTAFNKNFGTTSGTVAQGNDSRINNGNTAFTWGNHASAGYSTQTLTAGSNISINGSNVISIVNAPTFTGNVTATNFILSSDERLKENIEEIPETEIIDVNWKSFNMKEDENSTKRYGVIAQELEIKHPEFVRTDVNGIKSVAYIDLLVAKMAEQENKIARLEAMVEILMKK